MAGKILYEKWGLTFGSTPYNARRGGVEDIDISPEAYEVWSRFQKKGYAKYGERFQLSSNQEFEPQKLTAPSLGLGAFDVAIISTTGNRWSTFIQKQNAEHGAELRGLDESEVMTIIDSANGRSIAKFGVSPTENGTGVSLSLGQVAPGTSWELIVMQLHNFTKTYLKANHQVRSVTLSGDVTSQSGMQMSRAILVELERMGLGSVDPMNDYSGSIFLDSSIFQAD